MDEIELTKLFLEYKETATKLAQLEAQIQLEIIARAESAKIAGVKATYYQSAVEYDYEAAARAAGAKQMIIDQYTTATIRISWKQVADAVEAPLDAFATQKPARVVIKA